MSALLRRAPLFLRVTTAIAGLTAYYALLTRIAFVDQVRRLLAVHFTTLPARPAEAFAIWAHNSRLVLGVSVCLALVWIVRCLAAEVPKGVELLPLWVCDAILACWAISVILTAGVLLGAYGIVQARAFWPYAPVEILAWALLLTIYIKTRNGHYGLSKIVHGLVRVEVLLAVAAILEVFPKGL